MEESCTKEEKNLPGKRPISHLWSKLLQYWSLLCLLSPQEAGKHKNQMIHSTNHIFRERSSEWHPISPQWGEGRYTAVQINKCTQFANHLLHKISTINADDIKEEVFAIKMDIHADSLLVVRHAQIIHCTGKRVSVSGFTNDLGEIIMVELVHGAVDYDWEYMEETYIMIIRNSFLCCAYQ